MDDLPHLLKPHQDHPHSARICQQVQECDAASARLHKMPYKVYYSGVDTAWPSIQKQSYMMR